MEYLEGRDINSGLHMCRQRFDATIGVPYRDSAVCFMGDVECTQSCSVGGCMHHSGSLDRCPSVISTSSR